MDIKEATRYLEIEVIRQRQRCAFCQYNEDFIGADICKNTADAIETILKIVNSEKE